MVRSFKPKPVSRKTIIDLLDTARRAPSAGHSQGVSFLVIDEKEELNQFWDISLPKDKRKDFSWPKLLDAPVIILPTAEPEIYFQRYGELDKKSTNPKEWEIPYWLVDAAFAVENLLLMVHSLELGALFFGVFSREAEIKANFQIPENNKLLGALAIGYPDLENERDSVSLKRGRRPQEEVIHFNSW